MNYFERRRLEKAAHLAGHALRHALRMREDVAPAAALAAAQGARRDLEKARRERAWDRLGPACDAAIGAAERLMPPRRFPKWRENVEVLVVAISMAMACRTYFIQPFKIPTGSMQPTLYGVTARPQEGRGWRDRFPANLVNLALFGERYVEIRAKDSGRLEYLGPSEDQHAYRVGNKVHHVRLTMQPDSPFIDPDHCMRLHFRPGDEVRKGDVIASGRVRIGDHIFVNKVLYHFARPKRGQIVVFDTNYIPEKDVYGIRPDTFYIKRLAGLAGETVSIRDGYLVADGKRVEDPAPFRRQREDPAYRAYVTRPGAKLNSAGAELEIGPKSFLPLGDNTFSSLDGRYFGPVSERAIVGPSFFVYWPFGSRWGVSR